MAVDFEACCSSPRVTRVWVISLLIGLAENAPYLEARHRLRDLDYVTQRAGNRARHAASFLFHNCPIRSR